MVKHSLRIKKLGGEGILDNIKSAVSSATPIVSHIAEKALPVALELGKAYAHKKIEKGGDILTDIAKKVIPMILSGGQLRKLKKGGAITINPHMIQEHAEHALSLLPSSAQKILKSVGNNKGIRHILKQGEEVINRVSGKGIAEDVLKTAMSIGSKFSGLQGLGIKRGRGASPYVSSAYKTAILENGGSIYPAGRMGGSIYPAGMSGGGHLNELAGDHIIQLGSPYQHTGSPAMKPFVPNFNPFHYAPNVKRGGDIGSDILGGLQQAAKFAPLLALI
jgi:hypothetical protein